MRIPAILAISLAAVLAGSLLLVGPFSINSVIPKQSTQEAEAQALPLMIRDRFTEIQRVGDAEGGSRFLRVNENFVDPENNCEFCTRVEYIPGPRGQAGFSYEDASGLDLSNAKSVKFWAMGEEGEEEIKVKVAGKSLDRQERQGRGQDRLANNLFTAEQFALTTKQVPLKNQWQKYEVDLTGVNLKGITHPFALELSENGGRQVVYLKGVVYDDEPAENPLATTADLLPPLVAEVTSNATEGVAPATFEFEANVTGGTEPYDMTWDFADDSTGEGQNVTHTFEAAGEYNVTLAVSDAGGQNASGSVLVHVAEPEVAEQGVDNDTLANTNATGLLDENTTSDLGVPNATADENLTAADPAEIQVDAGMDVVARPDDTITLGGAIEGANSETEGLELGWTHESGPEVELSGADSLSPTISIPDLEDDAEIGLELAASVGSAQDSDTVTVFVQHAGEVEGAQEEQLDPQDSIISEWAGECEDPADCMSDGSDDTFAAASPEDVDDVNLFSFDEFDIENAEIQYVTAVATARSGGIGYLLFVGAGEEDSNDQTEPDGAVPIASDSFDQYEFVWTENPVTGEPWTVGSLNSFLAGYAYGDGDSDIQVSEFSLVVTYTAQEPEEAPQDDGGTSDEGQTANAEDGAPDDTSSGSGDQNSEPENSSEPSGEEQGDPETTDSTSE